MKTILDTCKTLFLDKLEYIDDLEILVTEGFVSKDTESIQIGQKTLEGLRAINKTEESRQFKIVFDFDNIINFQLIDESFTSCDNNEKQDSKGFLQIIENSIYLDYVDKSHGWYKKVINREA